MSSIKDERGFNQMFENTIAAKIRKERRCDYMISKMDKLNKNTPVNILEIGCGDGGALNYISENTNSICLGVDLSKTFIDSARQKFKRVNLSYEVADFNNPESFQELMEYNKFDYVIGNGILHHLYYHLNNSLPNLYKLLKSNGKIIFIEPNIYNPYVALIFKVPYFRKKTFLEPDEMAFSDKFIADKLKVAGFKNIHTELRDFLLPNVPVKLIKPVIKIGSILERTPLTYFAQSIFITAEK